MQVAFDDLPLRRPGPPYNAWGQFGPDDELGRLNLITPEVVRAARDEIEQGLVINLNMPLSMATVHPMRQNWEHEMSVLVPRDLSWPIPPKRRLLTAKLKRRNHRGRVNDDLVKINTQTGTQWDGFRHYPYQDYPEKGQYIYFNGMTTEEAKDPTILRNGVHNYALKPITSRAVLLDLCRYREKHGIETPSMFDPSTPIPLTMLKACQIEQGVEIRRGDVLIVRVGWTEAYLEQDPHDREEQLKRPGRPSMGVEQGEEILRWHWDHGIAAVATDCFGSALAQHSPAYECLPEWQSPALHEVFLAGWGMPIGEMLDLRQLAAECARLNKWSFFFASMPLYIPGGIASPPNAQAIL